MIIKIQGAVLIVPLQLIKESLQKYGAARSIVIDEENRILAGNGTVEGAKQAGIKNVRVIETDGSEVIAVRRTGLSEDEKVGLALADNRTGDLSEWDVEMLHQLSEEHDISDWFTQEDLDELLNVTEVDDPVEGNTDPDEVPRPQTTPSPSPVTSGSLAITVLCGDSTNPQHVEKLMDGKKADMVFTDPPYGVEYRSNMSQRFEQIKNDDTILEIAPIIWQFLADDSAAFVWTSHHVYPIWRQHFLMPFTSRPLFGPKGGGGMGDLEGQYALDYEMALFCAKGSPKFQGKRGMAVWDIGKDRATDYVHPTQKPVALAEQALLISLKPNKSRLIYLVVQAPRSSPANANTATHA